RRPRPARRHGRRGPLRRAAAGRGRARDLGTRAGPGRCAMTDRGVATVRADQTVKDAFEAAAVAADRITVVVDTDDRVVGVLTDGDIRRAVLRGVGMDALAGDIVSAAPLLC